MVCGRRIISPRAFASQGCESAASSLLRRNAGDPHQVAIEQRLRRVVHDPVGDRLPSADLHAGIKVSRDRHPSDRPALRPTRSGARDTKANPRWQRACSRLTEFTMSATRPANRTIPSGAGSVRPGHSRHRVVKARPPAFCAKTPAIRTRSIEQRLRWLFTTRSVTACPAPISTLEPRSHETVTGRIGPLRDHAVGRGTSKANPRGV